MINENIKYYRKKRGMSQEEMAVRLHVVRQTVSKWENGLSVPDADMVICLAELLEVPVSVLLGVNETNLSDQSLSKELEKANQLLSEKIQKEKLVKEVNKKRSLIIFLSFVTLFTMLTIKNEIVSIILIAICILALTLILYRNLALLTSLTTQNMKLGVLRFSTIFNVCIFIIVMTITLLIELDIIKLSENNEKIFAMAIVSGIIILGGIICPKLPFTRHTGLRLPWTVQDEDTWNIAHQIIGYISFPVVILYIAGTFCIDHFETVSIVAFLTWIGIPAIISFIYFCKKQ